MHRLLTQQRPAPRTPGLVCTRRPTCGEAQQRPVAGLPAAKGVGLTLATLTRHHQAPWQLGMAGQHKAASTTAGSEPAGGRWVQGETCCSRAQ
jgi:hypothetical protein